MTSQLAQGVEAFKRLQDTLCQTFSKLADGQSYTEDNWTYDKGTGGGRTRVFESGVGHGVWSKGICSFSNIHGSHMPKAALARENASEKGSAEPSAGAVTDGSQGGGSSSGFHATGVSIVLHSNNPWVPSVHANVRFFTTADGARWWFGGGVDMTPVFPHVGDVRYFHRCLKDVYDTHGSWLDYAEHKAVCDRYFFLPHRDETRGVGGVFFDRIGAGTPEGGSFVDCLAFVIGLGEALIPIVTRVSRHKFRPFSQQMLDFAHYRRGRYVEFNLLYDRGTKFGLDSGGRTESILASMPQQVRFTYNWKPARALERYLYAEFLRARDWNDDMSTGMVSDPEEYEEYEPLREAQLSPRNE